MARSDEIEDAEGYDRVQDLLRLPQAVVQGGSKEETQKRTKILRQRVRDPGFLQKMARLIRGELGFS